IKQTARALWRDLWIVIKNDWRRKKPLTISFFPYEHRIGSTVLALRGDSLIRLGWIQQGYKCAVVSSEDRMCRNKRLHQRVVATPCRRTFEFSKITNGNGQLQ